MALATSTVTVLLTVAAALGLMAFERLRPNRDYDSDRGWVWRVGWLGAVGIGLTLLLGPWLDAIFAALGIVRTPSALSALPDALQGVVGYLAVTFFVYWWHRARHHSDTLWRWFHQVHHSTHRLQAATAFYAHPTDFVGNAIIVSAVAYGLLGYGIEAAAWTAFWVALFDVWEHTNVKTPRWLGFVIVRPEMHRVHHEKDRHRNNYGLPVWDLLFGTFENSHRSVECGFAAPQERRLRAMLLFKDAGK
jgi:sterol desaturase/sphingolipid hydroxylase (fatty acid hydroxylase superfamily)